MCRLRGARLAMVLQDPRHALNPAMRVGWQIQEAASTALAAGALQHPYSRQLLESSRGYDRARAASLVTFA